MKWTQLDYWNSGEWQVVQERLNDLKKEGKTTVPERNNLFKALEETPFESVKVAIIGQDPYPNPAYATGIAFDVPVGVDPLPPSLINIFKEYQDDLHLPTPSSGSLLPWCRAGVLLWNSIPSCDAGRPASHHWEEWSYLTKEIVERLDGQDSVVFCLLGKYANAFGSCVRSNLDIVETSHPSPLGAKWGFLGSRIFTKINNRLVDKGLTPIDWRLP